MALGVGLAVLFLPWLLYDAVWTTGRAVFIHLGAMLGSILLNNTNQRPRRVAVVPA